MWDCRRFNTYRTIQRGRHIDIAPKHEECTHRYCLVVTPSLAAPAADMVSCTATGGGCKTHVVLYASWEVRPFYHGADEPGATGGERWRGHSLEEDRFVIMTCVDEGSADASCKHGRSCRAVLHQTT